MNSGNAHYKNCLVKWIDNSYFLMSSYWIFVFRIGRRIRLIVWLFVFKYEPTTSTLETIICKASQIVIKYLEIKETCNREDYWLIKWLKFAARVKMNAKYLAWSIGKNQNSSKGSIIFFWLLNRNFYWWWKCLFIFCQRKMDINTSA